ncbi:hypothetical protein ACQJBY_031901 [Aegilops geniculata]
MSDGQGNAPPGGYFIGRPANTDETKEKEPPQAVPEPAPAALNTPGDYFVGRPSNHEQNTAAPPAKPSFLAKFCPCLAGGGATS